MQVLRLLRVGTVPALLLYVLTSCDVSLRPSEGDTVQEGVSLSLAQDGTLRRGDLIEIQIELPDETPGSGAAEPRGTDATPYILRIVLEDNEGVEVNARTVPYVPGQEIPPLTLDDLGLTTRRYRLTVTVLQGQEKRAESSVRFTFVGEEYAIREVTSDAPTVHPGSTVKLTAVVEAPVGTDPTLVWTAAGKTFAKGTLSQGLGSVQWVSPHEPAIYPISVSLYPLGTGNPAESLGTEVYVKPVTRPLGELAPAESYVALLHLLGNLSNMGATRTDAAFLPPQPLPLLTRGAVVGYQLDGTGGFAVPELLLPLAKGGLEPLSIIVGFTPDDKPLQGRLLRMESQNGSFALRLGFEAGATLAAVLVLPEGEHRVAASGLALLPGKRVEIALSLYPWTELSQDADVAAVDAPLEAVLFLDGQPIAQEAWPVSVRIADKTGSSTVGGPGSVTGLVDEVGVYYRDTAGRPSPDPGLFLRALVLQQGDRVGGGRAAGDGFDGPYLSPDFVVVGAARAARGALEVPAESTVQFPVYNIEPAGSSLRLTMDQGLGPAGNVTLRWAEETEDEAPILSLEGLPGNLEARLIPDGEELRVELPGGETGPTSHTVPRGERQAVVLSVENGADAPAIRVNDIAVWPAE